MSNRSEPKSRIADQTLTVVVEYTAANDHRHRECFYTDERNVDRVEQVLNDGQWRTVGVERVDTLSIRLVDADADLATLEGVEQ